MSAVRPTSRREALRAGALAAGAVAVGGLVVPLRAAAQATTETEELRDFLAPAVAREQILALAYAGAGQVGGIEAELARTLERFRTQAQAHVNALTSALEAIGYDGPDAPSDPEDDGVFDDVDGIDSEVATELSAQLARLTEPSSEKEHLDLLITLENQLIDLYAENVAALESEDLRTTCAEIAGNAAQHVVVLRVANGESLVKALDVRAATEPPQPEEE